MGGGQTRREQTSERTILDTRTELTKDRMPKKVGTFDALGNVWCG